MDKITQKDIEKYFGSLESALSFYKLKLERRQEEFTKYEKQKRNVSEFFNKEFYNVSINNRPITDLMERFIRDTCRILEHQVEDTQNMIDTIEQIQNNN